MKRIGIDLGGTNISIGVISENCEISSKLVIPVKQAATGGKQSKEIIDDIISGMLNLLKAEGLTYADIDLIGIGVPGIVNADSGVIIYTPNLELKNVPIKEIIEIKTKISVKISNDANCAALGEVLAGSAKGAENVILLTLGTGVGAGIIIDGKIYSGCYSAGGEIGHAVIAVDGRRCGCGRNGCFEAYASATALAKDALETLRCYPNSFLIEICENSLDKINGKMIFEAAASGDECAQVVVSRYIKYLGEGVITIVNIFRPEKIVLGGGIADAGDFLIKSVNEYIKDKCMGGDLLPVPPIVKAVLGNDAGVIGAGML
ncbi:MAG: ROK family protein [Defluviitaleaceae bacterium]|nr:ROK family protein [Defluviitaleaceae bacterium]